MELKNENSSKYHKHGTGFGVELPRDAKQVRTYDWLRLLSGWAPLFGVSGLKNYGFHGDSSMQPFEAIAKS